MTKVSLLLIFTILLSHLPSNVRAEEPLINRNHWQRLKDGHDYAEKIPKKKPQKIEDQKRKSIRNPVVNLQSLFKVLTYAAAVILILAAVYNIARRMGLFDKIKFEKEEVVFEELAGQMPSEGQLQRSLNEAMQGNNLRLAIRLLYALMLIQMHQRQWLVFSEEKSPRQYLRELSDSEAKKAFGQLVLVYERSWFGNYPLSQNEWDANFSLYKVTIEK